MSKWIYLEKELAEKSDYKSIQNAYDKGELTIVYFPRDNKYYFEKAPASDKTVALIEKELAKLYPGIGRVSNENSK